MAGTLSSDDRTEARITRDLLESVERDGAQSQRRLASELGIALGLVNAYLNRCIKKGLVKVREAPARRYAYYLTPKGFAEKSRLTVDYLSYSFSFFRQARSDCADALTAIAARNPKRVMLAGVSDLAEIAILCALERGVKISAVVDAKSDVPNFVGVPVVPSFDAAGEAPDAVLITDLAAPFETFETAVERFGTQRVFAPALLGLRPRVNGDAQ
jgi:predicted transcriptional regulator